MTFDRITFHPLQMNAKPCIRGMRVTVDMVVALVTAGKSHDDILKAYPDLETADIEQALAYAAWRHQERIRSNPTRAAWGWGWCLVGYSLLLSLLLGGILLPQDGTPQMDHLMFVIGVELAGPVAVCCLIIGWVLRRPVK